MKKYYILKLDSYEGETSSMFVSSEGADEMYVVLHVEGQSAEIVDWGYPSAEALIQAWTDVEFENKGEFV